MFSIELQILYQVNKTKDKSIKIKVKRVIGNQYSVIGEEAQGPERKKNGSGLGARGSGQNLTERMDLL